MNVAVYWYTNVHTVDNGGHGFSLGYKRGAFMESFLKKKVCKTGQACITFRNILITVLNLKLSIQPSNLFFTCLNFAKGNLIAVNWKRIKQNQKHE